jgi:hypothetical protein
MEEGHDFRWSVARVLVRGKWAVCKWLQRKRDDVRFSLGHLVTTNDSDGQPRVLCSIFARSYMNPHSRRVRLKLCDPRTHLLSETSPSHLLSSQGLCKDQQAYGRAIDAGEQFEEQLKANTQTETETDIDSEFEKEYDAHTQTLETEQLFGGPPAFNTRKRGRSPAAPPATAPTPPHPPPQHTAGKDVTQAQLRRAIDQRLAPVAASLQSLQQQTAQIVQMQQQLQAESASARELIAAASAGRSDATASSGSTSNSSSSQPLLLTHLPNLQLARRLSPQLAQTALIPQQQAQLPLPFLMLAQANRGMAAAQSQLLVSSLAQSQMHSMQLAQDSLFLAAVASQSGNIPVPVSATAAAQQSPLVRMPLTAASAAQLQTEQSQPARRRRKRRRIG